MLHLIKRTVTGFIRRKSGSPHAGIERRKAPRVKTPVRMDICFLEGPQEDFGDGQVKDISVSGLQFISDTKPARGAPMVLKLHFPKSFIPKQPLQIRAKVVRGLRIRGEKLYHVACAFMDVNETSHQRLQDFVRWISSTPS